ncbi:MAG: hypothetical protein IT186_22190 [Acidobacteria bacterium]|nr:hypothetical protein [Acidobacteriota bacterium]MCK6684585.1 hypothetical protein [Thermoanaerobaculia bacterium]
MASNVILFGWNRPVPGREALSAAHFGEFMKYLSSLRDSGMITSFETVFLDSHGGDLNGFFLIHGESPKLDEVMASDDWVRHQARAGMHLQNSGAVRGVTGDMVTGRFQIWSSQIPA